MKSSLLFIGRHHHFNHDDAMPYWKCLLVILGVNPYIELATSSWDPWILWMDARNPNTVNWYFIPNTREIPVHFVLDHFFP
jgi:hypothetical protein